MVGRAAQPLRAAGGSTRAASGGLVSEGTDAPPRQRTHASTRAQEEQETKRSSSRSARSSIPG